MITKESIFKNMTNLYSLSKTLRFELKPVGKTADIVNDPSFFTKDKQKAQAYPHLKEKMDALHRDYIQTSLAKIAFLEITQESMDDFFAKADMKAHFKTLRNGISESFENSKRYLEKDVLDMLLKEATEKEKSEIEQFKGFFGYFKTYTQNRANLYKNEDKPGQDFSLLYTSNTKQATQETITTVRQVRMMYDTKTKQTLEYTMTQKFDEIIGSGLADRSVRLEQASAKQCKDLIWAINLLMKMRNAKTGTDIDSIICPSCGFDSSQGFQGQEYNGDANGAYNIARKGILILNKIIAGEKSTIVKQEECDTAWKK